MIEFTKSMNTQNKKNRMEMKDLRNLIKVHKESGDLIEQERVKIWKDKLILTSEMMKKKLFTDEWIYKSLWA